MQIHSKKARYRKIPDILVQSKVYSNNLEFLRQNGSTNDQYIDSLPYDWVQRCVSEPVQVREHRFDFEREFGAFVNEGIII